MVSSQWTLCLSGLRLPIEIGVDYNAFRHEGRAIAVIKSKIVSALHLVAENGGIPRQRRWHGRVHNEQQLIGIKAMTGVGLIGAVDAIAIKRAGRDAREVAVKIPGRYIPATRHDAFLRSPSNKQIVHFGGVGGEYGKVGTYAAPMRSQRIGKPFLGSRNRTSKLLGTCGHSRPTNAVSYLKCPRTRLNPEFARRHSR